MKMIIINIIFYLIYINKILIFPYFYPNHQNFICLSDEPDIKKFLSGLNVSVLTELVCSLRDTKYVIKLGTDLIIITDHNIIFPSIEPDERICKDGINRRERILPVCPFNVSIRKKSVC